MTTQELTCVYNSFDKNRDGHVSYEEFLNTIRVRIIAKDALLVFYGKFIDLLFILI